MYAYMQKLKADALKRRYAKRNVYYICGERDTNVNDGSTSKTPGAMLQGKHRRERTEVFYAYLIHTYGPSITQRHKMAIAPRVRHYGRGNMMSTAGLRFLFADSP